MRGDKPPEHAGKGSLAVAVAVVLAVVLAGAVDFWEVGVAECG